MDSTKSAAHNKYMPGHTKVKHHEWRTAENSAAFLLPVLQSMAQTKPKLTLLDVGAGSGTITATLAKYMPQGHITAVDISTDILKSAADYATKQGVTAIDFKVGDIYALPFEDNTFDVVHASQVLSHLDGPVEAYKEMIRVTKPGGMVASRESDLTMWSCYPESPEIKRYHEIILKIIPASGGHISAGPRLVSWAMQAGAKREQITASMGTWTYSTPEERAMFGQSRLLACS